MKTSSKIIKKIYFKSFIFGLVISFLILFSLQYLNLKKDFNKKYDTKSTTKFDVVERKKVVEEKVNQEQIQKRTDLTPELDSVLEGFSFGLPSLELDINAGQSLLNGTNDGIMSAQAVDILPKPLAQPEMAYPSSAAEKGIQGFVEVSLLVSDLGQVEKVNVLNAKPKGVFEDAARASVIRWRFEPAEYKGKKVAVWLNQKINFSLE